MSEQREKNPIQPRKPEASERFTNQIMSQFQAEAGSPVQFTAYERALAQHLFLKVDSCLKEFEKKRRESGKESQAPFIWQNVNMRKLALDAVHRIQLGLDALIPAHIYPIPYFNGKEKLYDIDLRVGYRVELYFRRVSAVEMPQDVRLELVYSSDEFSPMMKSHDNNVEDYTFKIVNPFNRGNIIGGFAYISYKDPQKNKLVLVSEADFKKSCQAAKSQDFWSKYPAEMRYKTLVHRAMSHLPIDPKKVNAPAFAAVESDSVEAEIDRNANGEAIVVEDFEERQEQMDNPEAPQGGPEAVQDAPREPDF
mgnify:CR=1 FL=1